MKNDDFTPGEVREMLDLSRAALRYYIRKGLLDVGRNDENGYYTFTQDNLSDLRDISYLRQVLDFSVTDIQECFNAATPAEYEAIFIRKRVELENEVARKQIQLRHLSAWEDYLSYLKHSPDSIDVVEFSDPFLFSRSVPPSLDRLPLLSSSFFLEDGVPVFNRYGYCFYEPQNLPPEETTGRIRFPGGKYIYSMCSSPYEMDDPRILSPALRWAAARGYAVRGPIQANYFFRIRNGDALLHFFDVTIPFADCAVRTDP